MSAPETLHLPDPLRSETIAHYERFADRLDEAFHGIPLIPVYMPEGLDGAVTRGGALHHETPNGIASVEIAHDGEARSYLALDQKTLVWTAHAYAVGFESWSPRQNELAEPAYARILLIPREPPSPRLHDATDHMLAVLESSGIRCVILSDGIEVALWIPLRDSVAYPDLRAALHELTRAAALGSNGLLDDRTHGDAPIRLSVRTNAPGQGSSLPYAIIPSPQLRVLLPIPRVLWLDPLAQSFDLAPAAATIGNPFLDEVEKIGGQVLPQATRMEASSYVPLYVPRATVITASVEILSDGEPRTADQLIAELRRRRADLPASADRKYLYVQLKNYIERTLGRGRKPLIVQDPDRRFRTNHPPDDWPASRPPAPVKDQKPLIDRLTAASKDVDSLAFEKLTCEAFSQLGFVATHVGGNAAPDGYLDAPLGIQSYRVMIECKTSAHPMQRPDIYEASKYRDQYKAAYCALVGPEFGDTVAIVNEAATHRVAIWSVDDIARCIEMRLGPYEMRPLFESGVVEDHLDDLEWERGHGFVRRVKLVCELIRDAGWSAQRRAIADGRSDEAPHLTIDAAMFLANEALSAAGSKRAASRAEVEAAFAHLTDPLVAQAVKLEGQDAIILTSAGSEGSPQGPASSLSMPTAARELVH